MLVGFVDNGRSTFFKSECFSLAIPQICVMDYVFEKSWKDTLEKVGNDFGEELDLQALLFLIGVQELGQGYRKFKKDEKVEVMHVAICTLLEPSGFYEFVGRDEDGWPHFKRTNKLPHLGSKQQELLIKSAIIEYFNEDE
jgi:hypothetical protein